MMSMARTPDPSTGWRGIVFDLDGTLMDSYRAITASVNEVRRSRGLAELGEAEVRPHVGRGLPHLLKMVVPGTELEPDAARYRAHHPSVLRSHTDLLPGVEATLRALHQQGFRLGVCSNKPRAFTVQLLADFGLAPLFATVVGPEDAQRPKPAPDMLIVAIERLQLRPAAVLYVGDMTVDVETARAAGVTVWVIATGSQKSSELVAARPDRLLARFDEIAQLSPAAQSAP